ncbi:MAG: LysM peptidoglycan-binding domain-containing protein, partial [Lachnospiraceae bacterium]|nr:LysM peptidoglycan-binding domain-containing protein [Lachnospiraceae bacterium]
MVNLSTAENVVELLEASIHRYDTEEHFSAGLTVDSTRELPVLIPKVIDNRKEADGGKHASDYLSSEGFYGDFDAVINGVDPDISKGFDDFDYGIVNVSFANNVDVIESYLPKSQITDIDTAIEQVTKDTEQKTIYVVVAGDTLSGIAEKVGITIDDLINLNENITGPNSIIRVGDEIVVTVPKPELSVRREELVYYEGTYEAPIEYVYNDNWYTTTEVTLQDPSSGYHKAVQ